MGTENRILRMACKEWSLLREIKGMGETERDLSRRTVQPSIKALCELYITREQVSAHAQAKHTHTGLMEHRCGCSYFYQASKENMSSRERKERVGE